MKRVILLATFILIAITTSTGQNIYTLSKAQESQDLKVFRQQIDSLDTALINLLAKRMQVCLSVGEYKKEHNLPVIQANRYHEILEKRSEQGVSQGLSKDFVRKLIKLIHTESVRQQRELIGKQKPTTTEN